MRPAKRNLTGLTGIERIPAGPFPQDILQVIQQPGAPASRAQHRAVHCRVPDRNGPAIRAGQTADSMADPPRQRPGVTRIRDRLH